MRLLKGLERRLIRTASVVLVTTLVGVSVTALPAGAATISASESVVSVGNTSVASPLNVRATSCPTAQFCVSLIEYYEGGQDFDQFLTDNNGSWSTTPAPTPANEIAPGADLPVLRALTCFSSTNCVAFGTVMVASTGLHGSFTPVSFADVFNGVNWHVVNLSNPNSVTGFMIQTASCPSTSNCVVVGAGTSSSGTEALERMNWSAKPGAWVAVYNYPKNVFHSVFSLSCVATTCRIASTNASSKTPVAVGSLTSTSVSWTALGLSTGGYGVDGVTLVCSAATSCRLLDRESKSLPSGQVFQTQVQTLSGAQWTTANLASGFAGTSVSCSSASTCLVTGTNNSGTPEYEYLQGSTWISSLPNLGTGPSNMGSLLSVACSSSGVCDTVGLAGDPLNSADLVGGLIHAASYVAQDVPSLPDFPAGALVDVSCASSSVCVAVGAVQRGVSSSQGLVSVEQGGVWTSTILPFPTGYDQAYISSVSCVSATFCQATENVYDASGASALFVLTYDGTTWTSQQMSATLINSYALISCAAVGNCTVAMVGSWSTSTNGVAVAVEHNGSWNFGSVSIGTNKLPNLILTSLRCPSATQCVLLAQDASKTGIASSFLDTITTSTLQATVTPGPVPAGSSGVLLSALSCISASQCVVVGTVNWNSAANSASKYEVYATWANGAWKTVFGPAPTPGLFSLVQGLSCTTLTNCVAVGSGENSSDVPEGIVGTVINGVPHFSVVPNASGVAQGGLNAVSCGSATTCSAVGAGFGVSSLPPVAVGISL